MNSEENQSNGKGMTDIENEKKQDGVESVFRKKYVYVLIVVISGIGIMIPFLIQFLLPFLVAISVIQVSNLEVFEECMNSVESWNMFVGIILGMVALITSLISMVISFKNTDDSNKSQVEVMKILTELKDVVAHVKKSTDDTKDEVMRSANVNHVKENVEDNSSKEVKMRPSEDSSQSNKNEM